MASNPVLSKIIRIGQRRGVPKKHILAAVETGLVESGLRNLDHGDADSLGWRQERKSLYPNPRNVRASVNRFYDEAAQHDRKGISAGELAARVQRPAAQYRGRYDEREAEARGLLAGKVSGPQTGRNALKGAAGGTLDQQGFQDAQRRALLSQFIARRRGTDNPLFKSGLLDTAPPDPADFTRAALDSMPAKARTGKVKGAPGALTDGGGYAGTQRLAEQAISIASTYGIPAGSQKRATTRTASGNISDHYEGNKVAYAVDFPATGRAGDKLAKRLARQYGLNYRKGEIANGTVQVGKRSYRVQLIWGTGDHLDHVHLGFKRVK